MNTYNMQHPTCRRSLSLLVLVLVSCAALSASADGGDRHHHGHDQHHHQHHQHKHAHDSNRAESHVDTHAGHPPRGSDVTGAGQSDRPGSGQLNEEYRRMQQPQGTQQTQQTQPQTQTNPGEQYYKPYYNPSQGQGQGGQGGQGGAGGFDYSQYYNPSGGGGGTNDAGGNSASDTIRSGAEGSSSNIRASGEMAQGFMPGHRGQPSAADATTNQQDQGQYQQTPDEQQSHAHHATHGGAHPRTAIEVVDADMGAAAAALQLSEHSSHAKHRHSHKSDDKESDDDSTQDDTLHPAQSDMSAQWQQIGQQYAGAYVPSQAEDQQPRAMRTTVAFSPLIPDDEADGFIPPTSPAYSSSQSRQSESVGSTDPSNGPAQPTYSHIDAARPRAQRTDAGEELSKSRPAEATQLSDVSSSRRHDHHSGAQQPQQPQQSPAEQAKWREIGMAYQNQYAPPPLEPAGSGARVTSLHESSSTTLEQSTHADPANRDRALRKSADRNAEMARKIRMQDEARKAQQHEFNDEARSARTVAASDTEGVEQQLDLNEADVAGDADVGGDGGPSKSDSNSSGSWWSTWKIILLLMVLSVVIVSLWTVKKARDTQHEYQPIQTATIV